MVSIRFRDTLNRWRYFRNKKGRRTEPTIWLVPSMMIILGLLFLRSNIGGPAFLYSYSVNGAAIFAGGQWYRLFTGIFFHWDLSHFIMNLISLWLLGTMVESLVGAWRTFVIYIMGGLLGTVLSATLSGPFVHSIGASGAILGLLGYLIATRITSPGALPQDISRFAVILLIMNLLTNIRGTGLDVLGHLGGFIGGFFSLWVVGLPLYARLTQRFERKITNVLKGVLVFLLWLAVILYPIMPHIDLSVAGLESSIQSIKTHITWEKSREFIYGIPQMIVSSFEELGGSESEDRSDHVSHPLTSYDISEYSGNASQVERLVRSRYSTELKSESLAGRNPFGVASYAQLWTAEVVDAFIQRVAVEEEWDEQQILEQRNEFLEQLEEEFVIQVYLFDAGEYGDLEKQVNDGHYSVMLETNEDMEVNSKRINSRQQTNNQSEWTFNEVIFSMEQNGKPLITKQTEWIRLWIQGEDSRFYFEFNF